MYRVYVIVPDQLWAVFGLQAEYSSGHDAFFYKPSVREQQCLPCSNYPPFQAVVVGTAITCKICQSYKLISLFCEINKNPTSEYL